MNKIESSSLEKNLSACSTVVHLGAELRCITSTVHQIVVVQQGSATRRFITTVHNGDAVSRRTAVLTRSGITTTMHQSATSLDRTATRVPMCITSSARVCISEVQHTVARWSITTVYHSAARWCIPVPHCDEKRRCRTMQHGIPHVDGCWPATIKYI